MNPPRRLLDDPDLLSSSERHALLAGERIRPPAGQRDAIWASLGTGGLPPQTPPSAAPEGASGSLGSGAALGTKASAISAVTSSLAFKSLVMIGSVISISVATYQLTHPTTPAPAATSIEIAPAHSSSATDRGATPEKALPPADSTAPTPADAPPQPSPRVEPALENGANARASAVASSAATTLSDPPPATSAAIVAPSSSSDSPADSATTGGAAPSEARQESLLVGQARDAVRRGDGASALKLLDEARVRFPRGVLGQEREALSIEALAASGQTSAASQRASAFIQGHPDSPYVARLRRFAP